MTAHTTIVFISHDPNTKLTRLSTETEMPGVNSSEPHLSVISNSANSSQRRSPSFDTPRKSHEKTISGIFTYTNGTAVETGYPDHRLDQYRIPKVNNIQSPAGPATGANGSVTVPTGEVKGTSHSLESATGKIRPQSKPSSTHSNRNFGSPDKYSDTVDTGDDVSKDHGHTDRHMRILPGEELVAEPLSSMPASRDGLQSKKDTPDTFRSHTDGHRQSQRDQGHIKSTQTAETTHGQSSSLLHPDRPMGHRLSLPSNIASPTTSAQERTADPSLAEPPRLAQRHTLQVPRNSGTVPRESRDFSFSAGDEALLASGRFSPTRDNFETSVPRHRRPSFGLVRRTTRSMASDAHLDEVPPDEDAARWTEVIKQKRASRRRRKEEEDDDRVVVGKKVEEGHVNWVTAYNMLTGIRFTVSRTNAKMDRELTDADFDAKHKFSFDVTGNELTPSAKYDFKFKDYSPWIFRRLRAIFGLDPADYLMSLTSKYILSELGSPGKSGSFFYFSRDYKYIIKTIHHAEHKLLRKILREYYTHVRDNPNTLISQFYGLHRVKIPYGRKIHFVVMNNLFPPHRDIHQTFDLKGSTVGRDFKEEDLESNPRATLKDLNWLRRDLHLEFQEQIKQAFIDQIKKDVNLLQRLHIMDYSLLVGMHDLEKGNEENVRETTLQVFQPGGERDVDDIAHGNMLMRTPSRLENARKARELRQTLKKEKPTPMSLVQAKMPDEMKSTDMRNTRLFYSDDGGITASHEDGSLGDQVYYLGVIDCLTHYGFVKRLEHFWKGLSNSRTQISPIPPEAYGERFINFITGITMTQEEAGRRRTLESDHRESVNAHNALHHHHLPIPLVTDLDGTHVNEKSPTSLSSTSPTAVDKTMQKAQKEADKSTGSKSRRESEEEVPDRTLRSIIDPEGDGVRHANPTTLPVVEEIGEGSSDTSRSVSQEKPNSSGTQSSGIRKVSTSTSIHRTSEEQDFGTFPSRSELGAVHSPREDAEATRATVNDAFRPIPSLQSMSSTRLGRDKPPRLGSGLIPHLSPMYDSADPLDMSLNYGRSD